MKQITPKTIKTITPEPEVKKKPSKPAKKTGLSKSDPNYYAKIGLISSQKRKQTSADFSAMAKASHPRPAGSHHGGRKKKVEDGTAVA
jgi:hypothetical protein